MPATSILGSGVHVRNAEGYCVNSNRKVFINNIYHGIVSMSSKKNSKKTSCQGNVKVRKSLNFIAVIAVIEEERVKWEAAKTKEAQRLVDKFSTEAGKTEFLKLNKGDGR